MEVKACKICRNLYNDYKGLEVCPECEKKHKDTLEKEQEHKAENRKRFISILTSNEKTSSKGLETVKEYALRHHKAPIMEIALSTGVTPATILNWVKDEKLEFSDDSKFAWFSCERCGTKISCGRLCYKCK